jgi:hypothetical protein
MQDNFFMKPEFCKNRAPARSKYDCDFYRSKEAERLDAKVGGALKKKENSAWELGLDFYQPFSFNTLLACLPRGRCQLHPCCSQILVGVDTL